MTNEQAQNILTERFAVLQRQAAQAASAVKLVCGVANNAAWLVMLDGYDAARKCRNYRHEVKKAFRLAIKAWHDYEGGLLYARHNRMFHVPDMTPEARKRYGSDITDREYYEFWKASGGAAYTKTKPLLNSLWNKHRLSLLSHGVRDAEHVAWVITAMAALELAEGLFEAVINDCVKNYQIPRRVAMNVFGQFSLRKVREAWGRAMTILAPDSEYDLDPIEKRNIELGVEQLCNAWLEPQLLYDSTLQSVEEYDEIFATKGYWKKTQREIAAIKNETMEEIENGN